MRITHIEKIELIIFRPFFFFLNFFASIDFRRVGTREAGKAEEEFLSVFMSFYLFIYFIYLIKFSSFFFFPGNSA